jgi:hypothetical protein
MRMQEASFLDRFAGVSDWSNVLCFVFGVTFESGVSVVSVWARSSMMKLVI